MNFFTKMQIRSLFRNKNGRDMGETLASNGSKANHDHFRCQMKTSPLYKGLPSGNA